MTLRKRLGKKLAGPPVKSKNKPISRKLATETSKAALIAINRKIQGLTRTGSDPSLVAELMSRRRLLLEEALKNR